MQNTLLNYNLSADVTAFSTTRISPFNLSQEEIVQMGTFSAFNVTHYCGDNDKRVKRNLKWLSHEIKEPQSHIWLPHQTHSDHILCIDANLLEKSQIEQRKALEDVDALISDQPHQCIGISTADCVPILIYDSVTHTIAAIHAGWRGTVKQIVSKTLQAMIDKFGVNPHTCQAIIGPSISVEAFEVGEEVVDSFCQAHFPESIIQSPKISHTKYHIDLWAANSYLLEQGGLPLDHIQIAGICTYQHSDTFFSARKLGIKSGRIFTAIKMK